MTRLGPYDLDTIVTGDARDLAAAIPDESIDLVLTDPPYGISYKMTAPGKITHDVRNTERAFGADDLDTSWLLDAYRILKPNRCAFVFTRWDVLHIWKEAAEAAGFVTSQRLIWDKSHFGSGDLRYYGSQTEDVLFLRKGAPSMCWDGRKGNVYKTTTRAYFPERSDLHPTQKPESIARQWIQDTTQSGQIVVDFFVGSGTFAVVAKQTGRRFLAFELRDDYAEIARERVHNTQPPLFVPEPEQATMFAGVAA
jgi:site-specific DNA-methyltransferase (adenine-specific)